MTILTPLIDAAQTVNLPPSELLILTREVGMLVVAKIPPHIEIYLVPRNLFSKIPGLPPRSDPPPSKFSHARWIELNTYDIERICELGSTDIAEFSHIVMMDGEQVIRKSASDFAQTRNHQPNRHAPPPRHQWIKSSFVATKASIFENSTHENNMCNINIRIENLFVISDEISKAQKHIKISITKKPEENHDEDNKCSKKPAWMSTNLWEINEKINALYRSDTIDYQKTKKELKSWSKKNMKTKGAQMGVTKRDVAESIILSNVVINSGLNSTGINRNILKKHARRSNSISEINEFSKRIWEKHIDTGRRFPSASLLQDELKAIYGFDDQLAEAAASIIMPDNRTR